MASQADIEKKLHRMATLVRRWLGPWLGPCACGHGWRDHYHGEHGDGVYRCVMRACPCERYERRKL